MAKSKEDDDLDWLDTKPAKPKRDKKRVSGVVDRLKNAKATDDADNADGAETDTTPVSSEIVEDSEPDTTPVAVEGIDEINDLDDAKDNKPHESEKRGDAVPVPAFNPIASAVKPEQDTDKEEEEEEKTDDAPVGKKAKKDDKKTDSVNPISASVREAAAKKDAPTDPTPKRLEGPIFIIDPASDQWIAEDAAEAVPGKAPTHPKKHKPNVRAKQKRGFWGFISGVVFVCFLLLLVAGLAVWFARDYLIQRGEKLAIEKFDEEGIFLKYEGRSYAFPRGLIFSDVTIYETKERKTPLMKVGNFGINIDAWHLLSKQSAEGLKAVVTMKDATAIPFHKGQEVCQITGINADLFATQERLKINRLRGTLNGLDFNIEGLVDLPEPAEKTETPPAADSAAPAKKTTDGPILDFSFLKKALEPIAFETIKKDGKNPRIDIRVDLGADLSLVAEGRFSGRNFKWRNIPLDFVGVTFDYSQKLDIINLIDAQVGYDGGTINAGMRMLLGKNKLENLNVTSNADLIGLGAHFAPDIKKSLAGIELLDAPMIHATGTLDLNEIFASNLTIHYQHWKGITIAVGEKTALPVSGINGQFVMNKGKLSAKPLQADVFGGKILANISNLDLQDKALPFRGTIEIHQVPVQKLAALGGSAGGELTGLLTASFRGKGAFSDLKQLNGSGDLKIDGGKLYKVPVIGPIQKLLATVIPIFGNRERSALSARFEATSGIIITNDLLIRSDGTKVKVSGSFDPTKQTTKFKAKANLDGPLGLATGLAAEMLAVEGNGPVSDLKIKLAGVPEGLSGIAGGGLDAVGNLLGGKKKDKKPDEATAPETRATPTEPAPAPAPANKPPAAGPPGPVKEVETNQ